MDAKTRQQLNDATHYMVGHLGAGWCSIGIAEPCGNCGTLAQVAFGPWLGITESVCKAYGLTKVEENQLYHSDHTESEECCDHCVSQEDF